jgi:hypothetical protein
MSYKPTVEAGCRKDDIPPDIALITIVLVTGLTVLPLRTITFCADDLAKVGKKLVVY